MIKYNGEQSFKMLPNGDTLLSDGMVGVSESTGAQVNGNLAVTGDIINNGGNK